MAAHIEVSKLSVEFNSASGQVKALSNIDMTVPSGRAVAIVGESGSGKSTLLMSLIRLLPPTAKVTGQILLNGKDVVQLTNKEMRAIRGKDVGVIFQNPSMYLNPTKTIGQQMIEPLLYHHMATPAQAKKKAIELLGHVGISDPEARFDNYPFEFSGGMLQRAMIGTALIAEPNLLIADEPTTALDVTVQAEILVLIKKLQRERGMTLIFVTHDLAVAAQVADEIYVLFGGHMVEHIQSDHVLSENTHPYLQGLIRSIPRIDGPRGPLPVVDTHGMDFTKALQEGQR